MPSFEHKAYITVKISADDFDDAESVFNSALDAFFETLDQAKEYKEIKGYKLIDLERK